MKRISVILFLGVILWDSKAALTSALSLHNILFDGNSHFEAVCLPGAGN